VTLSYKLEAKLGIKSVKGEIPLKIFPLFFLAVMMGITLVCHILTTMLD
jgi:hypothetical protein